MRILRYATQGRPPRVAVAIEDGSAIDLAKAWGEATGGKEPQWVHSTLALIEGGPQRWAEVVEVAGAVADRTTFQVPENDVRWLCPLDPVPSLRDFLAFENHVKRGAERRGGEVPAYWYEAPVYYKGNHRSILGPDDECAWPRYTERLDFELELAMIAGVRGRDIAASDAADHIFGFTILNDFSARDIQAKEISAWLGPAKGKDFANALGPAIVTADELGPEPDLAMICRVNGDEWGRARSSESHWSWADMMAHVSMSEDVYPGDVYGSGTPGGCCGLDLDRYLEPGDVVELEIEHLGILRNTIGPRT